MKSWIASVYKRLPIIRELRAQLWRLSSTENRIASIESQVSGLARSLRLVETTGIVQALEVIKASDPRYRDPCRLLIHGAQFWSQNYEDGMISEIFRRVPPIFRTFLEIGVGDGSENNTTALLAQGWSGCWIEGNQDCCNSIELELKKMPALAQRLVIKQSLVTPDNVEELLTSLSVPSEVDLFSLDIDLNSYHIWSALGVFRPRVVVVEYNGAFPPNQVWIQPYQTGKVWDGTQSFGASLKAFELLGRKFGYYLVGCDLLGINAFFVREDLVDSHFPGPFTAENHFEPPRYGLWYRWAHRSRLFGESHVPVSFRSENH